MHTKSLWSCTTLFDPLDCSPPDSLCPWDSPGKNTGVDCHALLQRIFPTQGSTLHVLSPALAGKFFTTSTTWEARTGVFGSSNPRGSLISIHIPLHKSHFPHLSRDTHTLISFNRSTVLSVILMYIHSVQFSHSVVSDSL